MMRLISLLVVLLLSTGCQSGPDVVPEHYNQKTITASYLQKKLLSRQGQVKDLRAFIKTIVTTPRRDQSFRQVILLKGKDRLRLDTLTPFNQPVSIFIQKGETARLFDLKKHRMYQGLEVWNMMHEILGTVIDFSEYVPVFYGDIPRLDHMEWTGAELNEDKTQYTLTGQERARRVTLRIRLNAETLLPESMQKWVGPRPLYSVAWDEYKDVEGYSFPHQVIVARAAQKDQVTLVYSDPVINKGVSEETFSPKLPGLKSQKDLPNS